MVKDGAVDTTLIFCSEKEQEQIKTKPKHLSCMKKMQTLGCCNAMFNVGNCYEYGNGVTKALKI